MSERFQTLHPEPGKQGVNIERDKYDAVRTAILDAVDEQGEIAFGALPEAVEARLDDFDGSIGWYVTTVKLDLEARELLERVPGKRRQHLRRPADG